MAMMKRIFLFFALNALVLVTISLILNLLDIQPYLTERGINFNALLSFCLIWGMAGAFISLSLSRIMAKWMMGVRVIDPQAATGQERQLVDMVYRLAKNAGLPAMPQVGIYQSPEVNAFATGPTRSRSLVAVSSGLLGRMESQEVEAVLAHDHARVKRRYGYYDAFARCCERLCDVFCPHIGLCGDAHGQSPRRCRHRVAIYVYDPCVCL